MRGWCGGRHGNNSRFGKSLVIGYLHEVLDLAVIVFLFGHHEAAGLDPDLDEPLNLRLARFAVQVEPESLGDGPAYPVYGLDAFLPPSGADGCGCSPDFTLAITWEIRVVPSGPTSTSSCAATAST